MASPVASLWVNSPFASGATNHNVTMPATIAAGDLLFIFMIARGSVTFTTPAGGWAVASVRTAISTTFSTIAYKKIADGTEDGTTVNVVTSASAIAQAGACKVTGWNGVDLTTDVVSGTPVSGTSNIPNPPSAAWAWGSLDALSLVFLGTTPSSSAITPSTNYTNVFTNAVGSGTTGAKLNVDERSLTADPSDENPSQMTMTSAAWIANTIVISGPSGTAHTGAASLAGVGAVTAAGRRGARGVAALAGVGSVAAVGKRGVTGVSALAGVGSVTAAGRLGARGVGALAGVGTIAAAGTRGHRGAAAVSGVGTVAAVGTRGALGAAALAAIATLNAIGTASGLQLGAASLTGLGSVTAAGRLGASGAASLAGVAAVAAVGSRGTQGVAALAGAGTLAAIGTRVHLGIISLAGVGVLTASGKRGARGAAALTGVGSVAAVGLAGRRGSVSLAGIGAVVAAGRLGAAGRASLVGIGSLTASATLVVVVRVVSRQRPRVYLHDGATLQRIAQLTRVQDINRSFSLRDRVHTGSFQIARSDPQYALTSEYYAHVVVIESSEYPYPWVGRIVQRSRAENGHAANVVADTYEAILGERFLPPDFQTPAGTAAALRQILGAANGANATGIGLGANIEAASAPVLSLGRASPLEAIDQLAELVDMEWWLGASVDRAGDLSLEINMLHERGADFSNVVRLSGPGGNFELEDWRGTNRGNAYAQTVVGGQTSVIEAWSERESSRARRGDEGALLSQDVNDFVVQVQRSIRFGHLVAGETSFAAPTQRREWRQVVEALKGAGDTGDVAARALQRHRFPSRAVIGMAYPDAETWPYLEVGNMIWLSHPEPFDDGYDGPATIIDVQPIEHRRMTQVILEVE